MIRQLTTYWSRESSCQREQRNDKSLVILASHCRQESRQFRYDHIEASTKQGKACTEQYELFRI